MSELRPSRLGEDVAAKPELLRRLGADDSHAIWADAVDRPGRLLLAGMGSSYFAASVAARRLRRAGVTAVAERASVEASWPPARGDVALAVSAGGSSAETLRWTDAYVGSATRLAVLANGAGSALAERAVVVVDLAAGVEVSGVSVRSYAATLVRLLQLEEVLTARSLDLPARCATAAAAIEWLLAAVDEWVADAVTDLAGTQGTWLLAPAERSGSAQQGALMLREAPRRAADACETGDWSHVDVYLTKTLDYRALVFAGSAWDEQAAVWMRERGSTFWAVGGEVAGAARTLRYPGDDDPVVALLAEVTVAELMAAALVEPA